MDIVAVGRMKVTGIGARKRGASKEAGKEDAAIRVLLVSGNPVKGGWDRARAGGDSGGGKTVGHESNRGLGGYRGGGISECRPGGK